MLMFEMVLDSNWFYGILSKAVYFFIPCFPFSLFLFAKIHFYTKIEKYFDYFNSLELETASAT